MTQLSPPSAALTSEQLARWGMAQRLDWEQRRDRWLQGIPAPPEEQQPWLALALVGIARAPRIPLALGQHQLLDAAAQHLAVDGGGLPLGLQPLQLLHHLREAAAQLRIGPEGFIRLPLAAFGLAEALNLLPGGFWPPELGRLLRWPKQWVHCNLGLSQFCHGCAALAWLVRGWNGFG